MKLTIVLLTAAFLNVSARGTSQTVTFSGKDVSLEKIFAAIEKQTGYAFVYTDNSLQETKLVSVDVKDVPLEKFLGQILKDQPLKYYLSHKSIFLSRKTITASTSDSQPIAEKDLSSFSASLLPPGEIRGKVMNENGEPLAGANIKVNGTNLGTSTDDKGYYKIENIVPGEYTLVITYVGYSTKTITVKVSESGMEALDFKLNPSLVNLDQLTVTGTLSKRAVRAYPATIAEIKGKDLQNRNLNNIANVLDAIPGMIMTPGSEMSNSGNIREPQGVLIRGTGASFSSAIKYLIDGMEIVSPGGVQSILQTMDPNNIEKIEILKGPMASTLYGSGAAGGVISITTKKGKEGKTRLNFKTMFTQYANDYADYSGYNQNYSANVSGGGEQFNYLLGAGYNLYPTTKLTDTSNGIDDKTWSYTAKIYGKVKNIAADLSLQYGNEKNGVGSRALSDNKYRASIGLPQYPVNAISDSRTYQRSFLTNLHLTHTIANNWYQDLTVGYNIVNYMQSDYTKNSDSSYSNNISLFSKINARYFMFYDHQWSKILKSSITAGFEYIGYEMNTISINTTTPLTNFFSSSNPAVEGSAYYIKSPYSSTGYFAEVVTGFKNDLFLTTGIRYDVNPAYGDNVGAYAQPRVGLSYVIESGKFKIKPRVVWGVSSDPPNPLFKVDNTTSTPYFTTVTIGNSHIKPQRSQGYEFGADLFYGSDYSLNVTYYDQKIKDMIQGLFTYDFSTSPFIINSYYYNIGESINKGLEVSAKAVFEPFTIDLAYTQTTNRWGDITGQDSSATVHPRAPNLAVPKRSIFARLSYTIPSLFSWTKKGGRISLDWKYNGSSFNYDEISYNLATNAWGNLPDPKPEYPNYDDYLLWQKGYSYFNLRADYSITNYAALYIDIQNLLDKQGSLNGRSLSQFPGRRINFGFNLNF